METGEAIELQIKKIKSDILSALGEKADASKVSEMQCQLDALDTKLAERHVGGVEGKTLGKFLEESDSIARLLREKKGTAVVEFPAHLLERKTAITSTAVGAATSGVLQIERIPGIIPEARQALTIRDLLTARPTTLQVIDFVKVNSPLTVASPQQGEGHTKLENAVTFTTASERIRTLATWIPASRQVLDDMTELRGFLETGLRYTVDLCEEQQLLSGSGSGEDLNGLITQATAFDTGLLPLGGWNRIDIIGRVIQQITTAKEIRPTFIVLNPVDWWAIRLTKDTQGRYILGDPMGPIGTQQLFGLTPVITTNVNAGSFLIGTSDPAAAEIRDRMEMTVEIATQHGTYFTENMVAIRAEKRLALVVKRAASYITGSFTTSP